MPAGLPTSDHWSAVFVHEFRCSIGFTTRVRAAMAVMSVLTAILALAPVTACAHAIIVAAQPAARSTVAAGTIAIKLEFNSAIDSRRSSVKLQGPDGVESPVMVTEDGAGVLAGRATVTVSGAWRLRWQVLSLDGHITRGDIPFFVRDAAGAGVH